MGRIESNGLAAIENKDAIRNFFYFANSVRSEEKRCTKMAHQIILDQTPEVGSCKGVEAAGGFVEEKHGGLMKQRPSEA